MAKRKQSGFSQEFTDQLLMLTGDSPLLLVVTVKSRVKMRGSGAKGPWEMLKIEVSGCDGRITSAVINDPANVPGNGAIDRLPILTLVAYPS